MTKLPPPEPTKSKRVTHDCGNPGIELSYYFPSRRPDRLHGYLLGLQPELLSEGGTRNARHPIVTL